MPQGLYSFRIHLSHLLAPFPLWRPSLYAHLLDQHLWELISAKEMKLAGQKLLQAIAEQYNVEAEIINEGTLASMLASWQQQFNKIIAERLHPTAKES